MERYVVSRDLAQKLKDAGYPQNTVHAWFTDYSASTVPDAPIVDKRDYAESVAHERLDSFCAPMSDELLEQLLGISFSVYKSYGNGVCIKDIFTHHPLKKCNETFSSVDLHELPDLLAELWLWCKENGHLEQKENL